MGTQIFVIMVELVWSIMELHFASVHQVILRPLTVLFVVRDSQFGTVFAKVNSIAARRRKMVTGS